MRGELQEPKELEETGTKAAHGGCERGKGSVEVLSRNQRATCDQPGIQRAETDCPSVRWMTWWGVVILRLWDVAWLTGM